MNFKHLVLSAFLLSSAVLEANTVGWGNRPGDFNRPGFPPAHIPDQRDPWGQGHETAVRTVESFIGQYFMGQSELDLLADFYIRSQLLGLRVRDITITASTEAGQGRASLRLNGQVLETPKVVARQMASYTFRIDPFANVVGQNLRTINLEMQGRFYVEKVVFNLLENSGPHRPGPNRPPEGPQVEVVRQQINERIQQEGGLELFRMFNLGMERQGQTVRRVTVLARSARGYGLAALMVNNQQLNPQTVSATLARLNFELGQDMQIGSEIQGLKLYFRGDITIEEVTIELEKRHGGGGQFPPNLERRFEQFVGQRLFDTSGVELRSLMNIPLRLEERLVDSVELFLRHSDMGVRLKLCQVVQDRFQTVNCATPVTISSGPQIVRLESVNFARLKELTLSSRMGMIDIDRIVINFR